MIGCKRIIECWWCSFQFTFVRQVSHMLMAVCFSTLMVHVTRTCNNCNDITITGVNECRADLLDACWPNFVRYSLCRRLKVPVQGSPG